MSINFSSTAVLPTDLAAKSYASEFMRLFPNGPAPIWAVLANMKTKTALQFEHGYYTKTMTFAQFNLTTAQNAAATSLVVDSSANLTPGQTFQITSTGEIVLLVSVTDATHIVVVRGFGSTAAASFDGSSTPVLCPCVGNAHEEGSNRPNSSIIMPTRVINYTQIFRNTWALSDSLRATMTIAGAGNVAESRQDCALFHSADMEKALLFGQALSSTYNNQPIRTMAGIIAATTSYAPANIATAGSTTNYTQLEGFLDPVFTYQSDPKMAMERWLFVGGKALRVINAIGRLSGQYFIVDGQTNFGLMFSTFKISRGTFRMVEHPLLNTNATWAAMAIAVDFMSMSLAYLANRKTKSEEFGVDGRYVESGADAVGGSLTTEMTTEIMNPFANGQVKNLTAGAAG